MTSLDKSPQSTPFLLDRDLLDRNLEAKSSQGISCPHCSKTMEWVLGPKTKGTILDALAQGNFHESLMTCDQDDCPVDNHTFVRRISAQDDGTITIKTFSLDNLLGEVAYFRKHSKLATQNEVAINAAHQREIDELRNSFKEQLTAAVAQRTTEQLENAHQTIDRLQTIIAEIDGVLGVKPENRWASLKDRVAAAEQLAEICRLGNMTPDGLLKRARSWAEKQKKPKKK